MVNKNAIVTGLAAAVDLRLTFIDLFKKEGATDEQLKNGNEVSLIDGVSLMPVFGNPTNWTRPIPFGICQPIQDSRLFCQTFAYSSGRWKVVGRRQPSLYLYQRTRMTLYDLDNDPQERTDVSKANPDIYLPLKQQATVWVMNITADFTRNCPALAKQRLKR